MQNPIRILFRKIALRRNRSKIPHSILPLDIISHATVLVDPTKDDAVQTCGAVKQYFGYRNIPVSIFCPSPQELDFLGTIRKKSRPVLPEGSVELFICLISEESSFLAEYEAKCSKAAFKIGRCEFDGKVFDMTFFGPEGAEVSQSAVFASVKEYLEIIR